MRAHWRHLANTIELVHPSVNSSPQPKRQMDRFSRFCTAYGTKCLYFTMGALIQQNCPFPPGIWTSHVTHDALRPCEPTTETARRSVQPCLHRWPQSVPIWFACFALKIVPSHVGIWTSCNTWFIWPTRFRNANGNLIVSAVFAGLTSVTDWQSDRQTDKPRHSVRGGVIMRNYEGYGKATQSFHVSTNNFATIKSLSVRSKHLTKYVI